MKVMAIDHGRARSGVAVSDPTGTLARPLRVIERIDSPAGHRRLLAVIAEEAPERIVVGDPRLMSGRRGEQAGVAAAFAERVRAEVGLPVDLVDERLTTTEATRRLNEAGGPRRGTPAIDSLAACVLLESYLRTVGA